MSAPPAILSKLTATTNDAAERALEIALAEALPAEQAQLADVILERNRRGGWTTLIRSFHRLAPPTQQKILSRPRDLFGPLAETIKDSEGPARENVITIVHRCTDVRLVYLLAEAMMDSRPEVRSLAGNSLLEAVRRHWHTTEKLATPPAEPATEMPAAAPDAQAAPADHSAEHPLPDPDDARQLSSAIEIALRHYRTHRQQPVVLAALIHERQQSSDLWLLFDDPYDDRTRTATIILRSPSEPALARALFLALGTGLKPAAMAGLASVENSDIAAALASESFRLIDPPIRDAAQGVNHLKLLPAMRKNPPWNNQNWAAWLRLIEYIGLQPSERLHWLTRLLEAAPGDTECAAWRMCVSRAIADTGLAEAAAPLAILIRDTDERVARFAARVLLARRQAEWRERAAAALPTSPHVSVRRMASLVSSARESEHAATKGSPAASASVRGFDRAWNDYQRMPPVVQHNTARTVAADPAFAEQLRIKFQGTPQDIAQALKMIAALPNLAPYRNQIIAHCGHTDPRIAAHAVRLAGRLEDPRLRELLEAAAHHADPRVRSNAVESMEELHIADRSQQVLALLNSRHQRERATAIRALGRFNFATAKECLTRMLTDTNPLHRMSALWVVEQLNLLEIMRQVSSMARRDPNLHVRKRAAEMLETLSGHVSSHP